MQSDERRLHPSSLIFRIFPLVKAFLLPALAVVFLSDGERWQLWLPLLLLPAFLIQLYRVRTLRYRFTPEEMVVTVGKWFRSERHIPYERIQNVDLVQGPLHRMLDVGEVRIETASGSGAEATLIVLSRGAERELRRAIALGQAGQGVEPAAGVAAHAAGPEDGGQEDPGNAEFGPKLPRAAPVAPLLRLGGGEILRLAIDPGRSLAPLAVLYGLSWEFDLFERFHFLERFEAWSEAGGFGLGWLDGVLIGVAVLLALVLFSLVGTVLLFHDFTLRVEGGVFRVQRGLLTRVRATIPRRRIQLVTVHESLIHRLLGRARVRVGTAGGGGPTDEDEKEASWIAPLLPREELPRFLETIDARLRPDTLDWRPRPRKALHRDRRLAARLGGLLGLAVVVAWAAGLLRVMGLAEGAVALAPAPWLVMHALAGRRHRVTRWARDGALIALREGVLRRRTSFVLYEKLQSTTVRSNWFDRRWQMAQLDVDTAGGNQTGHRLCVDRLDQDLAEAVQDALVDAAEQARFRWV